MQINLEQTPYYHVVARCVRRAFLCGLDKLSGRNFDHRKPWLVERIKALSAIFAIDGAAYAVMSNHFHVVLHVDTGKAHRWSDDEVVFRWGKLFPGGLAGRYAEGEQLTEQEREIVLACVPQWRERLTSISWYMKCLNEFIARRANAEDNCHGRFWESRFRCQALLDDAAVLAAMCYVDLNPIRADMAATLEQSDFTSIQERIETLRAETTSSLRSDAYGDENTPPTLAPLMAFQNEATIAQAARNCANTPTDPAIPTLPTTLHNYLALVDWTGRQLRPGKRGQIHAEAPPILTRLGVNEREWVDATRQFNKRFRYAAGAIEKLQQWCDAVGRCWLQGAKTASRLYVSTT